MANDFQPKTLRRFGRTICNMYVTHFSTVVKKDWQQHLNYCHKQVLQNNQHNGL